MTNPSAKAKLNVSQRREASRPRQEVHAELEPPLNLRYPYVIIAASTISCYGLLRYPVAWTMTMSAMYLLRTLSLLPMRAFARPRSGMPPQGMLRASTFRHATSLHKIEPVLLGHPLLPSSSIPVIQTAAPRTDGTTIMTAGITRIRGSGGLYFLH